MVSRLAVWHSLFTSAAFISFPPCLDLLGSFVSIAENTAENQIILSFQQDLQTPLKIKVACVLLHLSVCPHITRFSARSFLLTVARTSVDGRRPRLRFLVIKQRKPILSIVWKCSRWHTNRSSQQRRFANVLCNVNRKWAQRSPLNDFPAH